MSGDGEPLPSQSEFSAPRLHEWKRDETSLDFTASSKEFAASAFLGRPQLAALNAPDFRNWSRPSQSLAQAMDNVTPVVATLAAYGEQVGSQWIYNQRPRQSRYLGGTAQGGFVLLPPEVGIDSFGDTFQPTNIGTISKPYFTMGPGARLGFGPPDLTDGTVDNGWSMSWILNSEINLDPSSLLRGNDLCLWQHASAASPAFAFFSDSQSLATLKENFAWKSNTDFWGVIDHANTANRLYTFPDADTTIHGGSGTANRLAYWSAATTLAANAAITSTHVLYADASGLPQGSANLTFDNITLTVAQSLRVGTASEVLAQGDAVFGLTTADRVFYDQSTNIFEQFETSTSDPVYRFTISGGNSYALGIDNSDSDTFKISYGSAGNAALGTNDYLGIATSGPIGMGVAPVASQRLTVQATASGFPTALSIRAGGNTSGDGPVLDLTALDGTVVGRLFTDATGGTMRLKSLQSLILHYGDIGVSATNPGITLAVTTGKVTLHQHANVGTATDAAGQGDFAAGLSAAGRLVWDQSDPSLTLYDSSNARQFLVNVFSGYMAVGTTTDPGSAGDFGAGLTGAGRLTYDQSANRLVIYNASNVAIYDLDGTDILWKSGTSFDGKLAHANTAARTYTFKDADGTVAFTSDITSPPSAATQAEQETGTSTTVYVSPGRQQYHASAAKAWVRFNGTGTVAINESYNVSSITDNGTGDYTVNFSSSFSASTYSFTFGVGSSTAAVNRTAFLNGDFTAPSATALRFYTTDLAGTPSDSTYVCVHFHGDLP